MLTCLEHLSMADNFFFTLREPLENVSQSYENIPC